MSWLSCERIIKIYRRGQPGFGVWEEDGLLGLRQLRHKSLARFCVVSVVGGGACRGAVEVISFVAVAVAGGGASYPPPLDIPVSKKIKRKVLEINNKNQK